jgi:hypothetical protein
MSFGMAKWKYAGHRMISAFPFRDPGRPGLHAGTHRLAFWCFQLRGLGLFAAYLARCPFSSFLTVQ